MCSTRILTVAISLVAISSVPALAQPVITAGPMLGRHFLFISAGGGPPPVPPVIVPPIMMGLQAAHLSEDQQNQVDQIMRSNREQIRPLIQQLQAVHQQIADKLLAPGTITEGDLAPLEDQAAQLDAKIQRLALNASVKVRGLLTPDQVTRMAQFHQKMAALQAQMKKLMTSEQSTPGPTP